MPQPTNPDAAPNRQTIVDFLRARYDEEEAAARAAADGADAGAWFVDVDKALGGVLAINTGESPGWRSDAGPDLWSDQPPRGPDEAAAFARYRAAVEAQAAHIVRYDPFRILFEIETKRQLIVRLTRHVEHTADPDSETPEFDYADDVSRLLMPLAVVYADHPDFDAVRWQP